jgi:hypothetical protein
LENLVPARQDYGARMVDKAQDADVISQCLWAVVNGPFFPDWEFHTLFGLERDEIRRIAQAWPEWDDEEQLALAVNNSLNNLLGYPHGRRDAWHDYITFTPVEVARVFARFRNANVFDGGAKGYFDRMI